MQSLGLSNTHARRNSRRAADAAHRTIDRLDAQTLMTTRRSTQNSSSTAATPCSSKHEKPRELLQPGKPQATAKEALRSIAAAIAAASRRNSDTCGRPTSAAQ